MQTRCTTGLTRNSNAIARERDARILWLLERHPATAGMLVQVGLFPSKNKALKRMKRLVQRKKVRLAGTVSLKDGRPEHVYCRGRPPKADNLLHEVQITRLCFRLHADEVRRGPREVDGYLHPDAELWINKQRYCLEVDCGTMSYEQILRKRFPRYRSCPDFVLWVCSSEARMEGLRRHAGPLRSTALFTTLAQALENPHRAIWVDYHGDRAALPRGGKGGNTPGAKPPPFPPPASGTAAPSS